MEKRIIVWHILFSGISYLVASQVNQSPVAAAAPPSVGVRTGTGAVSAAGLERGVERRFACWGSHGPPVVSAQCPRGSSISVVSSGLKVQQPQASARCVFRADDCGCTYGERGCNMPDVRQLCDGRAACRVDVTEQYIDGTKCKGFSGYMYIDFRCIATQVSLPSQDMDICQHAATNQKSGYIHSPNYPDQYPANQRCRCSLSSPAFTSIVISVLDFHVKDYRCQQDMLQLQFAGHTSQLCAHSNGLTNHLNADTNHVTLTFTTDATGAAEGFWLKYQAEPSAQVSVQCYSMTERIPGVNGIPSEQQLQQQPQQHSQQHPVMPQLQPQIPQQHPQQHSQLHSQQHPQQHSQQHPQQHPIQPEQNSPGHFGIANRRTSEFAVPVNRKPTEQLNLPHLHTASGQNNEIPPKSRLQNGVASGETGLPGHQNQHQNQASVPYQSLTSRERMAMDSAGPGSSREQVAKNVPVLSGPLLPQVPLDSTIAPGPATVDQKRQQQKFNYPRKSTFELNLIKSREVSAETGQEDASKENQALNDMYLAKDFSKDGLGPNSLQDATEDDDILFGFKDSDLDDWENMNSAETQASSNEGNDKVTPAPTMVLEIKPITSRMDKFSKQGPEKGTQIVTEPQMLAHAQQGPLHLMVDDNWMKYENLHQGPQIHPFKEPTKVEEPFKPRANTNEATRLQNILNIRRSRLGFRRHMRFGDSNLRPNFDNPELNGQPMTPERNSLRQKNYDNQENVGPVAQNRNSLREKNYDTPEMNVGPMSPERKSLREKGNLLAPMETPEGKPDESQPEGEDTTKPWWWNFQVTTPAPIGNKPPKTTTSEILKKLKGEKEDLIPEYYYYADYKDKEPEEILDDDSYESEEIPELPEQKPLPPSPVAEDSTEVNERAKGQGLLGLGIESEQFQGLSAAQRRKLRLIQTQMSIIRKQLAGVQAAKKLASEMEEDAKSSVDAVTDSLNSLGGLDPTFMPPISTLKPVYPSYYEQPMVAPDPKQAQHSVQHYAPPGHSRYQVMMNGLHHPNVKPQTPTLNPLGLPYGLTNQVNMPQLHPYRGIHHHQQSAYQNPYSNLESKFYPMGGYVAPTYAAKTPNNVLENSLSQKFSEFLQNAKPTEIATVTTMMADVAPNPVPGQNTTSNEEIEDEEEEEEEEEVDNRIGRRKKIRIAKKRKILKATAMTELEDDSDEEEDEDDKLNRPRYRVRYLKRGQNRDYEDDSFRRGRGPTRGAFDAPQNQDPRSNRKPIRNQEEDDDPLAKMRAIYNTAVAGAPPKDSPNRPPAPTHHRPPWSRPPAPSIQSPSPSPAYSHGGPPGNYPPGPGHPMNPAGHPRLGVHVHTSPAPVHSPLVPSTHGSHNVHPISSEEKPAIGQAKKLEEGETDNITVSFVAGGVAGAIIIVVTVALVVRHFMNKKARENAMRQRHKRECAMRRTLQQRHGPAPNKP